MVGMHFQINDWRLNVDENKLYRQDREVSVEPRLINLLYFLAKNPGEVFCREQLIEHVWGGAIVTDQVVTQSIFELRKLLRDGREESIHYLITVPKRGYKLVASVTEIAPEPSVDDNHTLVDDDSERDVEPHQHQELDIGSTDMIFPAGPLTRALNSRKPATRRDKIEIRRWKSIAFDVLWISALIIAFGVFTYYQSETNITQAIDTHLIEFTFQETLIQDQDHIELSDGLVQKLAADIAQVSHYRVRLSKARFVAGVLPGKTVTVKIQDQAGHTYLDVEYRNNASGTTLFSRQYPLVLPQIRQVIEKASSELMQALAVPDAENKASLLMAAMPENQQALLKLVRAHHYLNVSQPSSFKEGIRLLEEALQMEPINHYLQAELLVAYYVHRLADSYGSNHMYLDPIKITLLTPGMNQQGELEASGIPASLVAKFLDERGIVVEKTGPYNLLFLFSIGIDKSKAMQLLRALTEFKRGYDLNLTIRSILPALYKESPSFYEGMRIQELAQGIHHLINKYSLPELMYKAFDVLPEMKLTPHAAWQQELRGQTEEILLNEMVGRVSANMILPYPPGVPLVLPGEMVTEHSRPVLEFLEMLCEIGAHYPGFDTDIHGLYRQKDGSYTVKVLKV